MITRLFFSLLVVSSTFSMTVVWANEVSITFFPAELGSFQTAARCCGRQFEAVVPMTENTMCMGGECNGTIDLDTSMSNVLTISLEAPDGKEIELLPTGGGNDPNNSSTTPPDFYIPIEFQMVLDNIQGPELGSRECFPSQSFRFANMTSQVWGTMVDGLELIKVGVPASSWTTDLTMDKCRLSSKAVFGSETNKMFRFKQLSWTVMYDPTEVAQGIQTYRYDTSFTYSVIYGNEGSAKVVQEGGDPPTTSGAVFHKGLQWVICAIVAVCSWMR